MNTIKGKKGEEGYKLIGHHQAAKTENPIRAGRRWQTCGSPRDRSRRQVSVSRARRDDRWRRSYSHANGRSDCYGCLHSCASGRSDCYAVGGRYPW